MFFLKLIFYSKVIIFNEILKFFQINYKLGLELLQTLKKLE